MAVDDAQYYTTTNVNVVDVYIRYQFYYPPSFVRSSVQKPFQKSKCNETKILVHYILSSKASKLSNYSAWAFFITIKLHTTCLLLFYEKGDYLRNEKRYYGQ